MSQKFKNKYRIESARLQNWDYGWNGYYFVTICTCQHDPWFGEIVDGEMMLSEIGRIVNEYWQQIPEHFEYVRLDEFVIMPNHIHGIIIINKPDDGRMSDCRDAINRVSTTAGGFAGNKNPMINENLSRIIRWYKGRVTFEARKIQTLFAWQSRFHDHIIRDDDAYHKIAEYIRYNPAKWAEDKFYVE